MIKYFFILCFNLMNINNFLIFSECNLIFPETFVYISEFMDLLKQSGLIFLFLIKSFQITLLILNYYNLLYFLNNQLLNYSLNYNYSISANLVFFYPNLLQKI